MMHQLGKNGHHWGLVVFLNFFSRTSWTVTKIATRFSLHHFLERTISSHQTGHEKIIYKSLLTKNHDNHENPKYRKKLYEAQQGQHRQNTLLNQTESIMFTTYGKTMCRASLMQNQILLQTHDCRITSTSGRFFCLLDIRRPMKLTPTTVFSSALTWPWLPWRRHEDIIATRARMRW